MLEITFQTVIEFYGGGEGSIGVDNTEAVDTYVTDCELERLIGQCDFNAAIRAELRAQLPNTDCEQTKALLQGIIATLEIYRDIRHYKNSRLKEETTNVDTDSYLATDASHT